MASRIKTLLFPPFVVFMAVTTVALSSYFVSRNSLENEKRITAEEQMKQIEDTVLVRLNILEELLRAGVGLFSANENINAQDWEVFIKSSRASTRHPGVDGIGYTEVLMLEDTVTSPENQLDGQTEQDSTNDEPRNKKYTSILYLEPQDERNSKAIGFDMFAETIRRDAMIKARDSGQVNISNAVNLVQDDMDKDTFGFLMYAPFYRRGSQLNSVDQRREAIQGYVYSAFNGNRFMEAVLLGKGEEMMSYEIRKASSNGSALLYKTQAYDKTASSRGSTKTSRTIEDRGSEWQFNYAYYTNDVLSVSNAARPMTVLLFGMISAVLTTGVTYLLILGKSRELDLTKERQTNEAKDNLLSIASHQLRTPATGVKQYLGMVLQGFAGNIGVKQKVLLAKAYESNERQLKTINDVLYLARLDSGRIILTRSRVDLRELVLSVIEELKDSIKAKNHKVELILPKRGIHVEADEHMVRMGIENLLTNAIKYTKPKGHITVELRRESKRGAVVAVTDNGVGIRKADINLLFKEFSRIPNSLSSSVSGTGIGLYLTKHLIMLHNGTISVKSKPAVGSTFTIHIPTKANL
jgi:signal transduction histidine kinase/sensor domain CHASE-containing protein